MAQVHEVPVLFLVYVIQLARRPSAAEVVASGVIRTSLLNAEHGDAQRALDMQKREDKLSEQLARRYIPVCPMACNVVGKRRTHRGALFSFLGD